jgi:hypothetical protein
MQQTIIDKDTKAFLNTMKPNTVREYATAFWDSACGADWDGNYLYLAYGPDANWTKKHWHKCSGVMAKSLAEWIKRKV